VSQLTRLGPAIVVVDLVGGGYLAWLGAGLTSQRRFGGAWRDSGSTGSASPRAHFWRGLATDLANPKTVVFFVGIFAMAVTPATPGMVRAVMLLGIVLTSALWRFLFLLSSQPASFARLTNARRGSPSVCSEPPYFSLECSSRNGLSGESG
jgi:threonine/homoserine/homoserine lactone efflux protein